MLHSHLRMTGAWDVRAAGERWRRGAAARLARAARRRARGRAVRRAAARAADAGALRSDPAPREPRAGRARRALRRAPAAGEDSRGRPDRGRSATRCSTSARSRGSATSGSRSRCFAAAADPWKPLGRTSDDASPRHRRVRPRAHGAVGARRLRGARRAPSTAARGEPARAAASAIRAGGQGEQNRTTYWCPQCQR